MKKIILILMILSLTGCSMKVHYKDTGLHCDRIGYKRYLVTNDNTHITSGKNQMPVYDVYIKGKKEPVVKSLRLWERAIVKADRSEIYTKMVKEKNRFDSFDLISSYNSKKQIVKYKLQKKNKENIKGFICLVVFDHSNNMIDAKEITIKNKDIQSGTWHVDRTFYKSYCNAIVYKK